MTTDLKDDIEDLIRSTAKDLDTYFDTGTEMDDTFRDAQYELIGRMMEILSRYEDNV